MSTTTFIGFGHIARSGKDTAAQALIDTFEHKYHIRKYALADKLKVEVYDALYAQWRYGTALPISVHYGTPPCEVPALNTDAEKIQFVNAKKDRLRRLLQRWGLEYRRTQNKNYWIDILDRRIHDEAPQFALITDIRFRNELGWVRGRGGVAVRVTRLGASAESTTLDHASESELAGVEFDYEITAASGDVQGLSRQACSIFESVVSATIPFYTHPPAWPVSACMGSK